MLHHRYANSGPLLPTPDAFGQVAFDRAAVVATPDVAYEAPVSPAAVTAIEGPGGRTALLALTAPSVIPVNQLLRLTPRLTIGYDVAAVGDPDQFLRVNLSLQVRVNGGGWGLCVADPALPAEYNGITQLRGQVNALPADSVLWNANYGLTLAGEHVFAAPAGATLEVRAAWQNVPVNPANYLRAISFTQGEGETGGWHFECGLAFGPVVVSP